MNKSLSLIAVAFVLCLSTSDSFAQEKQSLPFADKMLPALFNQQVQNQLELVEEQTFELKKVLDEVQEKRKQLGAELQEYKNSGVTESELQARRQEIIEGFEETKLEFQTKAVNVLLPHQRERLQQLTVQFMMKDVSQRQKVATGMLVPEIRDYLDIDDEQAKRINERADEIRKELAEKIRKLTEQAQEELMSELSGPQKAKYKKLVGETVPQAR